MITLLTEENRGSGREKCPSAILSTTRTGLGSKPGLRNETHATNSLRKINYATDVTVTRMNTELNITTFRKAHHTVTTDGYRLLAKVVP
jgi:hypothetical protein